MKVIYFAGNVEKGDWRNTLVAQNTGRIMSEGNSPYTAKDGGSFIYGGPFAISDDHGCFHGSSHGSSESGGCTGSFITETGDSISVESDGLSPMAVFGRCCYQIGKCDAVLAYIQKPDCYGTFFELGYAYALHKPIYLYVSEFTRKITRIPDKTLRWESDLWFIEESATIIEELKIPQQLLTFSSKQDYHEYLKSPQWKEISSKKRKEAGNKCQLCNDGGSTLHVHHRTYENIYTELMSDLIVLCENCHKKFHKG